jgi:hypothetical protein
MISKNSIKLFTLAFVFIIFIFILPALKLDPSNPPTGQTGAPSETTCSTASGCHNGGTFTGTAELIGIPASIEPNKDYSITLTLYSACKRTGFELTALDKNNAKCGTITAGANNNLKTVNGRQYVRQSNASTLSGGKASYAFNWKSPSTVVGDSVIFYYAMLQANGDGGRSGDNALRGRKAVALSTATATEETVESLRFKLFPNPAVDYVQIQLPAGSSFKVNIMNETGKIIMTFNVDGSKVLDVRDLSKGIYFVTAEGGGINISRKLIISKG